MSRVAKKSILLLNGVSVQQEQNTYIVKGKLGVVHVPSFPAINIAVNDNVLALVQDEGYKNNSALAGLLRSLLANAVIGVTEGFKQTLELKGLGYRAAIEGKNLILSLGFSHKVTHALPEDVKVTLEKDTIIHLEGVDKQRVGQEAAKIRAYKIPDSYHAKGILYRGEVVITKEGKKK